MRNVKWLLLLALAAMFLPWLGETLFNTKGEPREAIVAVSMLETGNWILPVSCGGDIPYKPPFLAWLIAIFASIFNGGVVNEFFSRLPSALAAIAMAMAGYAWCLRHAKRESTALIMAIVTVTSFEVFRAALACRVDMVLTACMVIALYQMYEWRERGGWLRYIAIAALLSGAVLTKGPVGALLPCLAMGIFCLLRRDNFFYAVAWLTGVCLLSFILPALWYWKAYQIGGEGFLNLAWEENIGRLTGNMGYDSHLNPWYYNLTTIAAGMLPWTLLAAIALAARWRSVASAAKEWRWSQMTSPSVFALVVPLVILAFYMLPASKRSVYLLPMYPFMAYGVAVLIERLRKTAALRAYEYIIFALALIAPVAGLLLQAWHPAKMPIEAMPLWRYPLALLPIAAGILGFRAATPQQRLWQMLVAVAAIYFAYASAFQPMVLNGKSDFKAVAKVEHAHKTQGEVYGFIARDSLIRYYTLNFYINDKIGHLQRRNGKALMPEDSAFCVLANPDDMQGIIAAHPEYECEADTIIRRSCDTGAPVMLGLFAKKQ